LLESKCDEASLQNAIYQIDVIINQSLNWTGIIDTSKTNLRKVIDCHANRNSRVDLFNQYEKLCERKVIIQNVMSDMLIKKSILKKEIDRCGKRSKSTEPLFRHFPVGKIAEKAVRRTVYF